MLNRYFRVNYYLETLETRTNPLFNKVRSSLLSEGEKRLIKEGLDFKDNIMHFNSHIQETQKLLHYDQHKQTYRQCKVSILLELQAQGKYIKLGEVLINLANILNCHRSKQLVTYKVDQCYDRNAKLAVSITLQEIKTNISNNQQKNTQLRRYSHYVQSHDKMRNRSTFDTSQHKYNASEHQVNNQLQYQNGNILDKTTVEKADVNMMNSYSQKIYELQEQIAKYQSDLTLSAQNILTLQNKVNYLETQNQSLKDELINAHIHIDDVTSICNQLKNQLVTLEKSKENQKEKLNQNANKYLKLFQDSQIEKNKMYSEINRSFNSEKDKLKQYELKMREENIKVKYLQKSQLKLKKRVQALNNQTIAYEKALKAQKAQKQKLQQQLKNILQKTNIQKKNAQDEKKQISGQKQQLYNELEMSKFSFRQLQIEITELKNINAQKIKLINQFEKQIHLSKQTIKNERTSYVQKIQEIQFLTEKDHQNMNVYMEQLQIKTINEHSKNNEIHHLKKEIDKSKKIINNYDHKMRDLELTISNLTQSKQSTQKQLALSINKNSQLMAKSNQLERQLKRIQEEQASSPFKEAETELSCLNEQQKEYLIAISYQERDLYWKEEIEKLQKDTKCFIQKSKRQKDNYELKLDQLSIEIQNSNQQFKKTQAKLKNSEANEQELKKNIKSNQHQSSLREKAIQQLKEELDRKNLKIKNLQTQSQDCEQLENRIGQTQKKLNVKISELASTNSQLDRQIKAKQQICNQIKQIINVMSIYINKSQKHKIIFEQLQFKHINYECILIFNSSIKLFCDRHNKTKTKLQQLQELKQNIQNNLKTAQKRHNSFKKDAKASFSSSCRSINSEEGNNQSVSTAKFRFLAEDNFKSNHQIQFKEDNDTKSVLKKQVEQLKAKNKKQVKRGRQLELQIQRQTIVIDTYTAQINRLNEQLQQKNDENIEGIQQLRAKSKQIQSLAEQNKQLSDQIHELKNEIQQIHRSIKMQKYQGIKKATTINRSSNFSKYNDGSEQSLYRMMQLQKKYKLNQEELQKLKRQKEDNKAQSSHNKQLRMVESKLKEKDNFIAQLKRQLETQKGKIQHLKELHNLKIKKIKQDYESEIEIKLKEQKEMQSTLNQIEEKYRLLQNKIKKSEETLKQANIQLSSAKDREQVSKKILQSEYESKLKSLDIQYQGKLLIFHKQIQAYKSIQQQNNQINQIRQQQYNDIRIELQNKDKETLQLVQKLQIYETRLINLEEEESRYQQTIDCLEKKIKAQLIAQKRKIQERQVDRQSSEIKSNFSLKTFTFR